jgi:threonine/homoserine/homoserine lactone efflux protein
MLPAASLIAFALALFVAAGSPGPSVGALVARVLTRGFRSVLPFLLAMWLGEAAWLTVAVMGLASIVAKFALMFAVLKLLGVAYLLFLAWRMWNATRNTEVMVEPEPQSAWQTFLAGLMITLGNPKIAIFYLALLPSLVNLGRITVRAWGELTLLTLLILAGVDLAWSAAAARTRQLLINRRAMRVTNRVGATVMAGAAVAIAVN